MLKINIAICDDNEAFIHSFLITLKEILSEDINSYEFYFFTSGEKLIAEVEKDFIPDIIFLDIDLKESMIGTSIGTKIKKIHPNILLVYISGYSCYYKELAQSEPFSFISKPIDSKELKDIISRAIKRLFYLKREFIFTYKTNGVINRVALKDVAYFESCHRIINMHMSSGQVISFYEKLDDIENEIGVSYPYFLRVNKSYYVNYHYVKHFSNTSILVSDTEIKISSKYKKKFMEQMYSLL